MATKSRPAAKPDDRTVDPHEVADICLGCGKQSTTRLTVHFAGGRVYVYRNCEACNENGRSAREAARRWGEPSIGQET